MPIIELRDIEYTLFLKNQKPLEILKNINLKVNKGEFHLITGPSGSGKTTLLQIIATFLQPSSGFRKIFNLAVSNDAFDNDYYKIRNRLGYLFQTPYLPPHFTVQEYIKFQVELNGLGIVTAEERAMEFLKEFNIFEFAEQTPKKLSGGERQRIALVGILAKDIDLLLLDEPTGSLDNANKEIIWNLITKLRNEKDITIISASHDETITNIADKTHKLDYGILE